MAEIKRYKSGIGIGIDLDSGSNKIGASKAFNIIVKFNRVITQFYVTHTLLTVFDRFKL